MIKINKIFLAVTLLMSAAITPFSAMANGNDTAIRTSTTPVIEFQTTGPLKLTPNMVEIVDLDEDAASIILSNPDHAMIDVQDSRRLIIRPGTPGVTSLTIISENGQIIYRRDIIVDERQGEYIRVRRMCEGNNDCLERGTFYCPDGCYEVPGRARPSSGGGSSNMGGSNSASSAPQGTQPQIILQPPPQAQSFENSSEPAGEE